MDEPVTTADVIGAPVFGAEGERIGQIDELIFELVNYRITAAVIGHGGFMGLGESHDPLPWEMLRWDGGLGGYVTGVPIEEDGDEALAPGPMAPI